MDRAEAARGRRCGGSLIVHDDRASAAKDSKECWWRWRPSAAGGGRGVTKAIPSQRSPATFANSSTPMAQWPSPPLPRLLYLARALTSPVTRLRHEEAYSVQPTLNGTIFADMADENMPFVGRYLSRRPPVDIEFTDLTYTVPIGRSSSKLILRNISGLFKSGELTAILGPSGAGKSTLLNVLAGYRQGDGTGNILVNGIPRDMRQFRKMSRYIMQEDIHQSGVTVLESILFSADLKLGSDVSRETKMNMVTEILDLLRLTQCKDTMTSQLSGGEKKRLSIAVELVNNPSVLFLDEPTTGLDDLSSSQCISLLKSIARGGRTVICSIHTPSAKLFALFDNVYIVAEGQCVFQGNGEFIIPFLSELGLPCPQHFNPADFVIEVSCGEYGYHVDKMTNAIDNGRVVRWSNTKEGSVRRPICKKNSELELDELKNLPDYGCSTYNQFKVLLSRMLLQLRRNKGYIAFNILMHTFLGLSIGGLFYQMGNDASKTIFNFGFCYISLIAFLYIPMLPVLVWFPMEVKIIKREHFNRWYNLVSYFGALTVSRFFLQLVCIIIYVSIVYTMSDQPNEWDRFSKFTLILVLIALASESLGFAISSVLDVVNSCFMGPAISVPLMLLAAYSFGIGEAAIPIWIYIGMQASYLRFGIVGVVTAIYGNNRAPLKCPPEEIYCQLKEPRSLLKEIGIIDANYWLATFLVFVYFVLFKIACYVILKKRLQRGHTTGLLFIVGQFIKTYFNLSH